MQKIILSLFLIFNFNLYTGAKIVVLICSYNNKNYYQQNLLSLFKQDYDNWTAYYIDDCSTDGTYELAYNFAKQHNMLDKMHFIKNEQNLGAMANQYHVITQCADDCVMAILDGDDQFYDATVLKYISEVYSDLDVWLTYGSYEPIKKPFPVLCADVSCDKNIDDLYFFRKHRWVFSHLRTFYAGLFKKIKKEDLMFNGQFLRSCNDHAVMFPMLEMANGKVKHFKYLSKKLYIYNNINPICEFRITGLISMENYIRNKRPHSPVDKIF